jgi:hypothetical protein
MSRTEMRAWIERERIDLFTDFDHAVKFAARDPDVAERRTWSMDMLNIADRIESATHVLGAPIDWQQIPYDVFPWYEQLQGVPIPREAIVALE